ncbi:MAG: PQQ-dependent sugar dehydrogenase [Solirubrobacterales bacterium]|nr:PQQ-dependent sugar dehydrogenase [Solirubrobacterales bacterium]
MLRRAALLSLTLLAGGLAACGSEESAAPPTPTAEAPAGPGTTDQAAGQDEVLVTGLEVPWGLAFLPDGDALVSERTTGKILRISADGREEEIMTVPDVATGQGEGGLLGLAVSPTYDQDNLVYAYFTSAGAGDNRVVRFELGGEPEVVLDGIDAAGIHNGGRIAFGPDEKLYVSTGDAGDTGSAQDRESLNGKILRVEPDGSVPADNPFPGSLVYSLGHRNVQGLAWDSGGRLWAPEFGQNTFDEVNLIEAGKNYGWPEVEGPGDGGGRFVAPKVTWETSESSPSGAAIIGSDLYVGALAGRRLWRIPLDGTRTGAPEKLLDGTYGRLRSPAAAPDGSLWVTTSNRDGRGDPVEEDDRIVRLSVG